MLCTYRTQLVADDSSMASLKRHDTGCCSSQRLVLRIQKQHRNYGSKRTMPVTFSEQQIVCMTASRYAQTEQQGMKCNQKVEAATVASEQVIWRLQCEVSKVYYALLNALSDMLCSIQTECARLDEPHLKSPNSSLVGRNTHILKDEGCKVELTSIAVRVPDWRCVQCGL